MSIKTGIQYKPISAPTTSIPDIRAWLPNVRRISADISATPTVDKIKPRAPPAKPIARLPCDNEAIRESPNIDNQKYSTGPKANATFAKGGAKNKSANAPIRPPATEA